MFKRILNKKKLHKNESDINNGTMDIKLTLETNHLLNIFPEIVWFRIADHLVDQNDLTNLINSSPFFRKLISRKRIHFLFKDVFQIILPHLVVQQYDPNSYIGFQCNSLQIEESVLKCRLVSHSWKNSIDELAEEFNADKNWKISQPNKEVTLSFYNLKECYNFSSEDLIEKFVNEFGLCSANSFFGGTVSITTPPIQLEDDLQSELYYKILAFLEIFGKYVANFNFNLSSDLSKNALEYVFVQLIGLLCMLPCLKNLVICNLGSPYKSPGVLQRPPKIQSLESLSFRFVSSSVCNSILNENAHISKLTITVTSINLRRSLMNLKQLELNQCSWDEFKVLRVYDLPNWPVQKLKLQFSTGVDWSVLFEILSVRFSETLEELELGVTHEELNRDVVNKIIVDSCECRLSLQKIKTFHLTMANYSTFEFLLGMKDSLESLRISWKVEIEESSVEELTIDLMNATRLQTVKILGYRRKLYKSNIWLLFPKLKTIALDGCSIDSYLYTRREWWRKRNLGISDLLKNKVSKIFSKLKG